MPIRLPTSGASVREKCAPVRYNERRDTAASSEQRAEKLQLLLLVEAHPISLLLLCLACSLPRLARESQQ